GRRRRAAGLVEPGHAELLPELRAQRPDVRPRCDAAVARGAAAVRGRGCEGRIEGVGEAPEAAAVRGQRGGAAVAVVVRMALAGSASDGVAVPWCSDSRIQAISVFCESYFLASCRNLFLTKV